MMWTPRQLDELIQQLIDAMPVGVRELPQDLKKNFRAVLQTTFSNMDLVTREEFDAQVAVLRRSREKLELLEKELTMLKNVE